MADKLEKRTVAVAGFPYTAKVVRGDGTERIVPRFAVRNEEIELFDPVEIERGDRLGFFAKPGEKVIQPKGAALTIADVGLMTDEQLADLFRTDAPTVKETLAAVGDDAGLAARVMQAERTADHEPRKGLMEKLQVIVEGPASE